MVWSSGVTRNSQWGIGDLETDPTAAEGKRVWGAKPPALGDIFQFFNKNNAFYVYFSQDIAIRSNNSSIESI